MYAYVNRTTKDTIIVSQYLQNGHTVTGYVSRALPTKYKPVISFRSNYPSETHTVKMPATVGYVTITHQEMR